MLTHKKIEFNPSMEQKNAVIDDNVVYTSHDKEYQATMGWSKAITLKNVEYTIVDSILYIKGTRTFHYSFDQLFLHAAKSFFFIKDNDKNLELETPFVESEIKTKVLWFFPSKIKGVDFTEYKKDYNKWYKLKKEEPFDCAMSNFKLIEK